MDDLMTPPCAEGPGTRWKHSALRAQLEWGKKTWCGACFLPRLQFDGPRVAGFDSHRAVPRCSSVFWDALTHQICIEPQPLTSPHPSEGA